MLFSSYLPHGNDVCITGKEDLEEDISLIHSFLYGCNRGRVSPFTLEHPYGEHTRASTKWFASYYSATLIAGFSSLRLAMIIPSFLLIMASFGLLFGIALNFSRSEAVASISLFLFAFVGGCGFVYHWHVGPRTVPTVDYVSCYSKNYTIEWGGSFLQYLIPMRHAQWSCALVLGAVLMFSEISFRGKEKIKELYAFAGTLLGFIPSVDARLLLPIVIYIVAFALAHSKLVLQIRAFAVPYISLMVGQISYIVCFLLSNNGIRIEVMWYPLYLRGVFYTGIAMWLENLGLFAILAVIVVWMFLDTPQRRFYLPSFVVFVASNIIQYQPQTGLNYIEMYPLWVTTAVVSVATMLQKSVCSVKNEQMRGAACAWCGIILLICTLSAILGTLKQFMKTEKLWSDDEKAASIWIRKSTSPRALFLGDCTGPSFSTVLTGRKTYCISDKLLARFGLHDSTKHNLTDFWRNPDDPKYIDVMYLTGDKNLLDMSSIKSWEVVHDNNDVAVYQRHVNL